MASKKTLNKTPKNTLKKTSSATSGAAASTAAADTQKNKVKKVAPHPGIKAKNNPIQE